MKPSINSAVSRRPPQIIELRVELLELRPTVWRKLLVPSWITLAKLHQLLQVAMGWTNSHLHQFKIGAVCYGFPDEDWPERSPRDDRKAILADSLSDELTGFHYEYDFGDGWAHAIRIERFRALDEVRHYPLCVAGANACPPEDVGGTHGYLEFLQAITDPTHEEHGNYLAWCGGLFDPAAFDVNAVNASLRRIKIPSAR